MLLLLLLIVVSAAGQPLCPGGRVVLGPVRNLKMEERTRVTCGVSFLCVDPGKGIRSLRVDINASAFRTEGPHVYNRTHAGCKNAGGDCVVSPLWQVCQRRSPTSVCPSKMPVVRSAPSLAPSGVMVDGVCKIRFTCGSQRVVALMTEDAFVTTRTGAQRPGYNHTHVSCVVRKQCRVYDVKELCAPAPDVVWGEEWAEDLCAGMQVVDRPLTVRPQPRADRACAVYFECQNPASNATVGVATPALVEGTLYKHATWDFAVWNASHVACKNPTENTCHVKDVRAECAPGTVAPHNARLAMASTPTTASHAQNASAANASTTVWKTGQFSLYGAGVIAFLCVCGFVSLILLSAIRYHAKRSAKTPQGEGDWDGSPVECACCCEDQGWCDRVPQLEFICCAAAPPSPKIYTGVTRVETQV